MGQCGAFTRVALPFKYATSDSNAQPFPSQGNADPVQLLAYVGLGFVQDG